MAMDDAPPVAWHVQDLTVADAALVAEYGVARGVGLSLTSFYRQVTTRIHFQDLERRPVVLPQGDIHHRNETLTGIGDPWALAVASKVVGKWSLAARAGVSVPLGHTVENPFALGRRGLPHEHIQFGTGTWNPMLGLSVGRHLGQTSVIASALARLPVYQNAHGYRAGRRYDASLVADRRLRGPWRAQAGLDLAHESAERWSGVIEEEGNLGRTDLLVSAALVRQVGSAGALSLQVKVPLFTHAHGSQVDYPAIVGLAWSR
ncbi:MAG TPA: hypothetical protein VFS78_11965 [Vicinamibacteria bacterium]|nr:hypothetical protein [Vicinamibacteria bacterium]